MRKKELLEASKTLLETNRRLLEGMKEMLRTNLHLVTNAGIAEGKMDVAVRKMNAAVKDIRLLGRMGINVCPVCAHHNHGQGCKECVKCLKEDNFKWRGAVKEDKA